MRTVRNILAGLAAGLVIWFGAAAIGANVPGMSLARGYIFRGNASGVARPYDANDRGYILVGDGTDLTSLDANDSGKVLIGDGTDLTALSINSAANKYLAAPAIKRTVVDFTKEPAPDLFAQGTHAVATAAANQVDAFYATDVMGRRVYFEMIQALQNDDLFIDKQSADPHGWALPLDNTDGDSIEITQGIIGTLGTKDSFTVGTDAAFYVKATFDVTTVADIDVLQVGFRKIAAYVDVTTGNGAGAGTVPGVYTDVATVGINHNGGQFRTLTDNDDGAPLETALAHAAWADGETHTLEVYVSGAGAVTYKIDGVADANAVAFSFDATDIVIPTIIVTATGNSEAEVVWVNYEIGHQ